MDRTLLAVTPGRMREMDREGIERYGIPGIVLMENAGIGIARGLVRDMPHWGVGRVVVLAGKGNNGGDGMVVARHLHNRGVPVEIVLVGGDPGEVRGDARINLEIVGKMRLPFRRWRDRQNLPERDPSCLWLDSLLGTGYAGSISGEIREAVLFLRKVRGKVVAVDIPSGLSGEDGGAGDAVVKADKTYTMGLVKTGMLVGQGPVWCGEIEVVDISLPRELLGVLSP